MFDGRLDAAETVVSIAVGRCLAPGRGTIVDDARRRYCHRHGVKRDRGASEAAAKRHDSMLDASAELLHELEPLLPVSANIPLGEVPSHGKHITKALREASLVPFVSERRPSATWDEIHIAWKAAHPEWAYSSGEGLRRAYVKASSS